MKYQTLNSNLSEPLTDSEAESALLRVILGELSPTLKKRIAAKLERERKEFERSSTPGHDTWYPHKVGLCAALERLTK